MGGSVSDLKEVKVLNRVLRRTEDGTEMEADPRHVELIARELELKRAKISNTPGSKVVNGSAKVAGEDRMKPEEEEEDEETEKLRPSEAAQFRGLLRG